MTEQQLIGRRLASARRVRDVRQVDLGAAIGVSDQTISNWEVGLRTPRADLLLRICVELDCSADFLLGLSDEMTPLPCHATVTEPERLTADGPELG